jgi:uncharacterized membrane protein
MVRFKATTLARAALLASRRETDMRFSATIAAAPLLLLAACNGSQDAPAAPGDESNAQSPAPTAPAAPDAAAGATAGTWLLEPAAGGSAMALSARDGQPVIRLSCAAKGRTLSVQVPAFRRIGSEERLSLGSGGEVVALVAAQPRNRRETEVSATGALPANLAALIAGPIAASYGAQSSGPHPAPPQEMARSFVAACNAGSAAAAAAEPAAPTAIAVAGACDMQGSERLQVASLRAVGTEPFWGARIEGRCVTYSHPEDQAGTRVWTRYAAGPNGGTWTGLLGGKKFELRTRAAPGCSDGMSDRRYPVAVDLLVGGEQRKGCAAPL